MLSSPNILFLHCSRKPGITLRKGLISDFYSWYLAPLDTLSLLAAKYKQGVLLHSEAVILPRITSYHFLCLQQPNAPLERGAELSGREGERLSRRANTSSCLRRSGAGHQMSSPRVIRHSCAVTRRAGGCFQTSFFLYMKEQHMGGVCFISCLLGGLQSNRSLTFRCFKNFIPSTYVRLRYKQKYIRFFI